MALAPVIYSFLLAALHLLQDLVRAVEVLCAGVPYLLDQFLGGVVALRVWGNFLLAGGSAVEILRLNGFFAALFVGSALLFRNAAREQTPTSAGSEAGREG